MKTRNTKIILTSIALSLMAITSIQAVSAQGNAISGISNAAANQNSSTPLSDSTVQALNWMDQPGTSALQEKVLMQINDGLTIGSLSAADATEYKNELNKLNEKESWYKSLSKPIPEELTAEDRKLLYDMSARIQRNPILPMTQGNALHNDVDELISNSLAHNRISSGQAEQYYLRLAQIESNIENSKSNPSQLGDQIVLMNKGLRQIKSELTHLH